MKIFPSKFVKNYVTEILYPIGGEKNSISKTYREKDIIYIHAARQSCRLAGLIKKSANHLSLTKKW